MTNILSTKEVTKHATLEIRNGMKKLISIPIAFRVYILIRNENIISEEHKIKTI